MPGEAALYKELLVKQTFSFFAPSTTFTYSSLRFSSSTSYLCEKEMTEKRYYTYPELASVFNCLSNYHTYNLHEYKMTITIQMDLVTTECYTLS